MKEIRLTPNELVQINRLLDELAARIENTSEEEFLDRACIYANRLPARIVINLNQFKNVTSETDYGVIVVKGYEIDDIRIGKTPSELQTHKPNPNTFREDLLIILYNSLLGDIFGWSAQRNGDLINDLFPIAANEKEQLSTSSTTLLEWHTEEAFHPYRADYLCLMCMRNHDAIPTTFASIRDVEKNKYPNFLENSAESYFDSMRCQY